MRVLTNETSRDISNWSMSGFSQTGGKLYFTPLPYLVKQEVPFSFTKSTFFGQKVTFLVLPLFFWILNPLGIEKPEPS